MADLEIIPNPDNGQPLAKWDGGEHGLGLMPRAVSVHSDRYPPVGSKFPTIPSAQWGEQDYRDFCVPVLDQGRSSSCLPHALVEAMGLAFAVTGDEKPLLSPWWTYGQINGGRDEGAALPDALHLAETVGVPPDNLVKHGQMFPPYPAEAKKQAARFRIGAAYDCPALADICSATERPGHVPVIGVDVGQNFEPDAEGFLPPFSPDPRGPMGHAITVVGKKYARGIWWPLIQNHWTTRWGMKGFAYLHPSYVNPYFGAWVLRTVRTDPQDPTPAPAAG
jgi:hypothetical protein